MVDQRHLPVESCCKIHDGSGVGPCAQEQESWRKRKRQDEQLPGRRLRFDPAHVSATDGIRKCRLHRLPTQGGLRLWSRVGAGAKRESDRAGGKIRAC